MPPTNDDLITRHLLIDGRVQGVGFRYSLRHQAQTLGLTGWVRNRSEGTVEALVHGKAEAIDKLTAWAYRGPPGARVDRVAFDDRPTTVEERAWTDVIQRPTY